jgi:hypothetical protein
MLWSKPVVVRLHEPCTQGWGSETTEEERKRGRLIKSIARSGKSIDEVIEKLEAEN